MGRDTHPAKAGGRQHRGADAGRAPVVPPGLQLPPPSAVRVVEVAKSALAPGPDVMVDLLGPLVEKPTPRAEDRPLGRSPLHLLLLLDSSTV